MTYKDIVYKKGMLVVLDENDERSCVRKIVLIVVNMTNDVYFVTEQCQSVHLVELGVHGLIRGDE